MIVFCDLHSLHIYLKNTVNLKGKEFENYPYHIQPPPPPPPFYDNLGPNSVQDSKMILRCIKP